MHDRGTARVHIGDDPIAIERLVGQQGIELNSPLIRRLDADGIVAISRQAVRTEPGSRAHRPSARDFGRPSTFRLAYRLTFESPFCARVHVGGP